MKSAETDLGSPFRAGDITDPNRYFESLNNSYTPQVSIENLGKYHDYQIRKSNLDFLIALEKQVRFPIPIVTSVVWNTRGALIEWNQVVELGLFNMGLVALPDNICQLAGLRALWMTHNRIQALPEDFGNLKALKKLLMYHNDITLLPESIADLDNLEFFRLDEKAATNNSEKVANWLKKQKEKLGPGGFIWN